MATAAVRKRRKKKQQPGDLAKVSVPLPTALHRALVMASLDSGESNSTLIRNLIEERFQPGATEPLRMLMPPSWRKSIDGWKKVSVFLPIELHREATAEVRRQYANSGNGNGTPDGPRKPGVRPGQGSLAAVAAALVAEKYMPGIFGPAVD